MTTKIKHFRNFTLSILLISLTFLLSTSAKAEEQTSTDSSATLMDTAAIANTEQADTAEENFNAGELIIEHISDSHEWHIAGNIHLPLPIIVYSKETGLSVFSSKKLEDGAVYQGYKLEHNHLKAANADGSINEETTAKIYDLSITKNVAAMFISIAIMLLIFLSAAKAYKQAPGVAPRGIQSFIEPIIVFVRDDIAKTSIGEKKYEKFMPYLLTIFFFIWINNLLGLIPLIPGGANVTGNIAIALCLAVFTFIITTINGNSHYWKHIVAMPGVPKLVLIILTPIEILGIFIKPFVLMVRLFANITSGHIVLLVFFCLIFIFGDHGHTTGGLITAIPALAFSVFINCLELLVGLLQAYVFTFLSAMYFGSALAGGHDDHH